MRRDQRHVRTVVLVAGALVTVFAAVAAHRSVADAQDRDTRVRLQDVVDREARQLDVDLRRWAELLATVNALDVDELDTATFDEFVESGIGDRDANGVPLGTYGGMRSFVWADAGDPGRTPPEYLVRFARPDTTAEQIVGVDLAQLDERRAGLELARDIGRPVVVGFFVPVSELDLPSEQQSQFGSLYVPVYSGGNVPATVEDRRADIAGWAITGFRASELLARMDDADGLAFSLVADGQTVGSTATTSGERPVATAEVPAFGGAWRLESSALDSFANRSALESPLALAVEVVALGLALLTVVELVFRWRASDRRRLEAVQRQVEAMREARLRLADRVSAGVLDLDPAGRIRWANDAAAALLTCEPEDLAGRNLEEVLVGAGARPSGARLLAERGWEARSGEVALSSGRRIQLAPTPEPDGGHLLTVFDVTAAMDTIDQLSESLDEAVRAELQGQRLIATMSHEVRTPLAGIVGLTGLALEDLDPDADAYATLRQVRDVGSDLLSIVNDALAVTVAGNGTLRLSPSPVRLSQFLDELLAQHRPPVDAEVELRWTVDDVGIVLVDSSRVRQILSNLVQNAVRHTEVGEVVVRADRADDGLLRLSVRDTGVGIPAEQQKLVFEPFWQVDDSTRRVGGAGMGLTVVKSLVDAMGGRLSLESTPASGSEFVVELPAPDAPSVMLVATGEPLLGERPADGIRAIVVDDDPISREVAGRQLERLGAQVELIGDAPAALSRMADVDADLVLVDLHLPGVDGFAILGEACATRSRTGRPRLVVAATASTGRDDHRRCTAIGADAVLLKPVDRGALAELLAGVVPAVGELTTTAGDRSPVDQPDRLTELMELGVLDQVVDLLTDQLPDLGDRVAGPDPADRRLAAHTLAGSLRTLGATTLAEEAMELEDLLVGVPDAATRLRVERLFEASGTLVERLRLLEADQAVAAPPGGAAR